MDRSCFSLITAFLLLAAPAVLAQMPHIELSAGFYRIEAEMAANDPHRAQGLMHPRSMPSNHGMLFVFPQAARHCMWMRNTYLPLSVAFLDEEGRILNIENMQPETLYELDNQNFIIQELLLSLKVLSHRISGYGLDAKVMKMVPGFSKLLNPFVALQNEVNTFIKDIDKDRSERSTEDINYRQIQILIGQCKDYISGAYAISLISGLVLKYINN